MNPVSELFASLCVLGLDVAKASVQAELRPNRSRGHKICFRFANTAEGFAKLGLLLREHRCNAVHAGLEATGPYSQALSFWLYRQGYRVSVLNPRRVKEYARSAGWRNKSDALDAGVGRSRDDGPGLRPARSGRTRGRGCRRRRRR